MDLALKLMEAAVAMLGAIALIIAAGAHYISLELKRCADALERLEDERD